MSSSNEQFGDVEGHVNENILLSVKILGKLSKEDFWLKYVLFRLQDIRRQKAKHQQHCFFYGFYIFIQQHKMY